MKCTRCDNELPRDATVCRVCAVRTEPPRTGDLLAGRFRLERRIGRGGIGYVWLAEDVQLENELVACKILKEDLHHDRRAVSDLKREVLLTRRLRHPNIVAVHSFWETSDTRFITMEYIEGVNLADALADRRAAFGLDEIVPWARQLGEALDYAHGQGVLHRDVKPGNVLLDRQGSVHLADFGIARLAGEAPTRLTGETTCGTLMYVSPEQLMGGELDARSDLYSLAATIYELLSGAPPFNRGSIVTQIQLKPAPPIPGMPELVNRILLKALAKHPSRRQETCGAFAVALCAAVQELGPGCTLAPPPRGDSLGAFWQRPDEDTVVLPKRDTALLRQRLGALLIEAGVITPQQLDAALSAQACTGEELGAALVRLGYAEEGDIAGGLARQLQIPVVQLENGAVDAELLALVTKPLARTRQCLPLRRESEAVAVAMANPLDLTALNELEATFHAPVRPAVATPSALLAAIERIYGSTEP